MTRYPLKNKVRVSINGFGRIGRCILRALAQTKEFQQGQFEVTAINDLTDSQTLAHLLKYDSNHGVFAGEVTAGENFLEINGRRIQTLKEADPTKLPWAKTETQFVMECTGRLKDKVQAMAHLQSGAKKVIISAPMKDADLTIVMGINDAMLDLQKQDVLSNASCTTNCLAPVAKVIEEKFGILHGNMTTVHSYTNDQRILDLPHSDQRRARAAAVSMIPTSTGAAKALGLVMPALKGKVDGISVRVPTPNVSLVDFNCVVKKDTSVEEVNAALREAAQGALKGILAVSDEELVSVDYKGRSESSMVDGPFTAVVDKRMIKVLSWYDNEWGFSCRMLDLACLMASQ